MRFLIVASGTVRIGVEQLILVGQLRPDLSGIHEKVEAKLGLGLFIDAFPSAVRVCAERGVVAPLRDREGLARVDSVLMSGVGLDRRARLVTVFRIGMDVVPVRCGRMLRIVGEPEYRYVFQKRIFV